ncbi:uncharacterized protein [Salmo salar]|uniref:CAP-Gly domain-containing protein n=1 Tax=Salmo salar TaxID=8030 RepID=A0A1S3RUF5_SALSA|nr:uncharacterized protein LOC106605116 [Salmo salar]|eukprot:XP_014055917.1 PREDICTED: uncharacterized protein LOC106605116 isoform X1 [Salmo salar]
MVTHILWCVFAWTFKGLLCTCRFFWVSPYYSIKYKPNEPHRTGKDHNHQVKQKTGNDEGCPHGSSAMQRRLFTAEREIQALKTQITFERATWDRKFVEMQRKQQDLRHQLISETVARPGSLLQVGSFEDLGDSEVKNRHPYDEKDQDSSSSLSHSNQSRGSETMSSTGDTCQSSLSGSQVSLNSAFSSRPISALSTATSPPSGSSWRTSIGPHRVFVPHSPLDLQMGHRVRVLLPSGRISTGTVRYLGHLDGEPDFHMGVELESIEHGQQDGTHRGQCYFECKAGHGAFVPFTKLLMAWE